MCNALEELKLEGKQEGIEEGILANIRTCKNFNISKEDTIRNLMKEFSLSEPEAVSYVKNTGKSVRRVFDHIGQRLFFV